MSIEIERELPVFIGVTGNIREIAFHLDCVRPLSHVLSCLDYLTEPIIVSICGSRLLCGILLSPSMSSISPLPLPSHSTPVNNFTVYILLHHPLFRQHSHREMLWASCQHILVYTKSGGILCCESNNNKLDILGERIKYRYYFYKDVGEYVGIQLGT